MTKHDEWWRTQATNDDICDAELTVNDFLPLIIPEIKDALHVGSNLVDFGCGIGRLTIPLAENFEDVNLIGVDVNQGFLEQAIDAAAMALVTERCYFMPYLDTNIKADAIISIAVLQHLPNEQKRDVIVSIARTLNTGGVFRFQYVEGDSDTFLTHDITWGAMSDMLTDIGFEIASVDFNLIKPRWTWVTGVKI